MRPFLFFVYRADEIKKAFNAARAPDTAAPQEGGEGGISNYEKGGSVSRRIDIYTIIRPSTCAHQAMNFYKAIN